MGLWLSVSLPAFAQGHAQDPASLAIAKGQEAIALFERGSYDEALVKFQQAEALYHSPVFLLYAARSLREKGRWVDALATLGRVAAEALDVTAPPPWRQAQADARREAAALAAELPSVIVTVERGSRETHVTIDGIAVGVGEGIDLDPGAHRIVASDGDRTESLELTLSPRARGLNVVIALPPAVTAAPKPPASTAPLVPAKRGLYVPGLVIAGAGTVTASAGAVVGVLALVGAGSARDGLPASCEDTFCLAARKDEIDASLAAPRRLATVADVLFVTGGIAFAVGVVMLIVHRSATASAPAGTARVWPKGGLLELSF